MKFIVIKKLFKRSLELIYKNTGLVISTLAFAGCMGYWIYMFKDNILDYFYPEIINVNDTHNTYIRCWFVENRMKLAERLYPEIGLYMHGYPYLEGVIQEYYPLAGNVVQNILSEHVIGTIYENNLAIKHSISFSNNPPFFLIYELQNLNCNNLSYLNYRIWGHNELDDFTYHIESFDNFRSFEWHSLAIHGFNIEAGDDGLLSENTNFHAVHSPTYYLLKGISQYKWVGIGMYFGFLIAGFGVKVMETGIVT